MLLFLPFMAVLTIFFFVISKNHKFILYLAIVLLAFLVDILAFMMYLGRDNYYYNIIQNYFGISRNLWDYFIFTPFSQDWIIRIMNLSSAVFLTFSIVFSASILPLKIRNKGRALFCIAVPLFLQTFVYDPLLYKKAYLFLYPDYLSAEAIERFYRIFYQITYHLNGLYLLLSAVILIYSYMKLRTVKLIKNYIFLIVVSCFSILITYALLLSWAPMLLIKVSKIAHFTSYLTIHLNSNVLIYHIFPYSLIFTLIVIAFGIYRFAAYQQRVATKNHSISTEIDAAAIATSVFSHYIKNQMISIMAELEDGEDLTHASRDHILKDCRNVLDHIDEMHALVENGCMFLQPVSLEVPIRTALSDLENSLSGIRVNLELPSPCPEALIDETYFAQALVNILSNAGESMSAVPDENKRLDIRVEEQSHWVVLSISDHGTGIKQQYIDKIFTPYFTTKDSSRNWGIGLSLCHKIIMAHSGKIVVNSKPGEGTTFTILIPDIAQQTALHRKSKQNEPVKLS